MKFDGPHFHGEVPTHIQSLHIIWDPHCNKNYLLLMLCTQIQSISFLKLVDFVVKHM